MFCSIRSLRGIRNYHENESMKFNLCNLMSQCFAPGFVILTVAPKLYGNQRGRSECPYKDWGDRTLGVQLEGKKINFRRAVIFAGGWGWALLSEFYGKLLERWPLLSDCDNFLRSSVLRIQWSIKLLNCKWIIFFQYSCSLCCLFDNALKFNARGL